MRSVKCIFQFEGGAVFPASYQICHLSDGNPALVLVEGHKEKLSVNSQQPSLTNVVEYVIQWITENDPQLKPLDLTSLAIYHYVDERIHQDSLFWWQRIRIDVNGRPHWCPVDKETQHALLSQIKFFDEGDVD